jgi:gliding motility-associated-like protein
MKKNFISILFFFISLISFSQENCNNGIDDDGDGRIDLSDTDCVCANSTITSIIPNPSFESYTTCPTSFSQLNVATPWIQATLGTTDYFNKDCSYIFPGIVESNLTNYPAGNGIVGAFFSGDSYEYLGTTLSSTMNAGTTYQLTFNIAAVSLNVTNFNNIGIANIPISDFEPINITLYGCTDGTNLPVNTFLSPNIVDPTWQIIGQVTYSPISAWGVVNLIFTPTININAIMIGPPPVLPISYNNYLILNSYPYFLFDNLLLNTTSSFGVNISSTGNFCENNLLLTANITNTVGTGTTYQWYKNDIAIVGATNSSYSVTSIPTNTGEYSVKYTNGSTCFISTKYLINNITPSPSATSIQPNCITSTGTINITTPAFQYSFDNGVTWQNSPSKSLLAVGNYLIKTKSINGCISAPTAIAINGSNLLLLQFTVTQPTTCGGTGNITINPSIGTQYSFDNGTTFLTSNILTGLIPGNYSLKIKDSNGCISSTSIATINPYINNIPLPNSTSPQIFCIQQNATINNIVINGQNIKWYDAASGGNLLLSTVNLVNGITYYASQTINGCESNRTSILVNIQNTPAPTATINQSFCSTENATLSNIIINGSLTLWYVDATSSIPLPSNTLLVNNTTYYASQTINNCESITRTPVTISLINTLNATNHSVSLCDDLNDNTKLVNLTNYNSFLTTSTNNIFKYFTTLENANQNSGQILNFTNYNLNIGTTNVYVRIENPNSCFQIVTLTFNIYSKPKIPINTIEFLCEGNSILLNAGNGFDSYTWSNGATTPTININQTGNYSVTVSKNYGTFSCTSILNFTIKNSSKPEITKIEIEDWTDENNSITIFTSGQGNYEYSINGVDYQDSNIFRNLEPGQYQIYVKDKNGCGIATANIFILNYPKFFTPNGDGYNDYWKIKFSIIEPKLKVYIYDRYGKFIFQFNSKSNGWNGNYNGLPLPATDYWFEVHRENGKIHKGHFSLKR